MKRCALIFFGLVFLLAVQVVVLPIWLPLGFVPDLLLLTVVLMGFWKPGSYPIWLGLFTGFLQGWLHGRGWWAFALSRAFAGAFAGWMRSQWLWPSAPAAGFCAGASTMAAESLLALLFALSERSLLPFSLLLTLGVFEAILNAILGFVVLWVQRPKEVVM